MINHFYERTPNILFLMMVVIRNPLDRSEGVLGGGEEKVNNFQLRKVLSLLFSDTFNTNGIYLD